MARRIVDEWLKQENLIRIQGWAKDGLTNDEIAEKIEVHPRTLRKWQSKYPEFKKALKIGKDTADRQVETSLYKAAMGYDYIEETVTNDGRVVSVKKHAKPNTTAQIFWLKNRKPEQWRDKRDVAHEGNINQNVNMSNLTEKELRNLANKGSEA